MTNLLVLFTIICPLFFWINKDVRQSQELFFQLGATIVVLANFMFFATNAVKRNKISLWIGILGIYSVALFLLGGCRLGATTMLNIFLGCMLYFTTLSIPKEHTHLIFKAVVMVCVINAVYLLVQTLGLDPIFIIRGNVPNAIDLVGFFGLKATMGVYFAIGMMAAFFINPWLAIGFLPALYISKSSGAILGAFAGILFYLWWMKRKTAKILFPIFLCLIVGFLVFIKSPMNTLKTRPGIWKMAARDIVYGINLQTPTLQSPFLRNIFTGFGIDAFMDGNIKYFNYPLTGNNIRGFKVPGGLVNHEGRLFKFKNGQTFTPDDKPLDRWDNLHNLFLSVFYDMGLIGLTICGFILYHIGIRLKNSTKSKELVTVSAMMIVILLSSTTQFPMYLARISYLSPILLGLFVNHSEV